VFCADLTRGAASSATTVHGIIANPAPEVTTLRSVPTGILFVCALCLPRPAASYMLECFADADATMVRPESPALVPAERAAPALEARAIWLSESLLRWPGVAATGRFRLHYSTEGTAIAEPGARVAGANGALDLKPLAGPLPPAVAERFRHVAAGITLRTSASLATLRSLHSKQLLLVHEDSDGRVIRATRLQSAAALDALYPAAERARLGVTIARGRTTFALWAPSARNVSLCIYENGHDIAQSLQPMRFDTATGVWSTKVDGDLSGRYYTYLVDVHVDGVGVVRNRVTDPYAVSLTTDSRRAYVADLQSPRLKPPGWDTTLPPQRLQAQTDAVIYELHVRDFSISDSTVRPEWRGKYLAFTQDDSRGMRHLQALAAAGVTDVHLLPVYDFGSVPEQGCVTPSPAGPPDGESQQAAVTAVSARDCFNWGYDPVHFTAPEGSYATDASDGAARIIEFRRMVQALHHTGLRVGMDVVYNHTYAAGQDRWSVLDRIVPGYYHRLDEAGRVTTSTCCFNTATEHRMMAKLMIDSAVTWAREYRIDSFRFDLMGHQPRAAMEELQRQVNAAVGRPVLLLGEGWNFGEVADGARFVQASQLSLNGSGIATFSDRARDAIRGGGAGDNDERQVQKQGFVNGLYYDRNADAPSGVTAVDLMRAADLVRVGLAGSLRDYRMQAYDGRELRLEQIPYGGGQPAGYVTSPGEVVNYVENHDNQTLYDLNAFKLPLGTSSADRARVQILAAALNAFSQGITYWHAGFELLRSKSMDRNSYDSGDWFNRLDWTGQDNFFGTGLPPARDNAASWPLMRPRLADARLKPSPADIEWTRAAFLDLIRIRSSSTLFRLRSAADVSERLRFLNTGPEQVPEVIAAHLRGDDYPGAGFREIVYLVNVGLEPRSLEFDTERGKRYVLHPAHRERGAADRRATEESHYDPQTGRFTVPARTAVVFVVG
jgi:pullulanase/glycogen debranching enzyme